MVFVLDDFRFIIGYVIKLVNTTGRLVTKKKINVIIDYKLIMCIHILRTHMIIIIYYGAFSYNARAFRKPRTKHMSDYLCALWWTNHKHMYVYIVDNS